MRPTHDEIIEQLETLIAQLKAHERYVVQFEVCEQQALLPVELGVLSGRNRSYQAIPLSGPWDMLRIVTEPVEQVVLRDEARAGEE